MKSKDNKKIKLSLVLYDLIIFAFVEGLLLVVYSGDVHLSAVGAVHQVVLFGILLFGCRFLMKIYRQIWRYGGIECYIKLLIADAVSGVLYYFLSRALLPEQIYFSKIVAICCINCLASLSIRMIYRYAYKCGGKDNFEGRVLRKMLQIFSFGRVKTEADPSSQKIRIAIIGAGKVGVGLLEDILGDPNSHYIVRCFVDNDSQKIGRDLHGVSVLEEKADTITLLKEYHIQEVILSVPKADSQRKNALYSMYKNAGFTVKVYDHPEIGELNKKGRIRDFNIEDLLMREQKEIVDDRTRSYYKNKVILITGGGGSIGSELCRQLAKMNPKQLIVLDIYENCAYDLQQSLNFNYKGKLDVRVEIVSITNKRGLSRVFEKYHPDVCIHAAAHKHVPLMEYNCIEAVENNVFGTVNVLQCCEEYGCGRFMMLSTDKAVNPTNVMGATKRLCEMIMQGYSTRGKVKCSATRFGNVLGSAGSVIPIFQRQIAAGGPVTITDKRIIRYFMTIPEASQLVLTSGAMAENGQLFVLDMGMPVKILDLAENMIALSGATCEIVETGLRPGEKLYEELLVKKDELDKTDNDLIFIEREEPISIEDLNKKLEVLKESLPSGDNEVVREAIRAVVPTYHRPEEVNCKVK